MTMKYSFCECAVANSTNRWHIRMLTDNGPKYSGGIDSESLCRRVRPKPWSGWDIKVDFDELIKRFAGDLEGLCKDCYSKYMTDTSEITTDGRTTWVNREILLGRFSERGVDVHVDGKCANDSCFPGPCGLSEWQRFKDLMLEHHHIVVPDDAVPDYLKELA